MKEVCVLAFLGWNAWKDFRTKEISLLSVALFTAAGILRTLWSRNMSWKYWVPMVIAALFLGISILSEGAVGMGDGLILLAMGSVLELEEFLIVFLTALFACAAWASISLMVFHKGRKAEIPYVPFLLAGYVGGLILWIR